MSILWGLAFCFSTGQLKKMVRIFTCRGLTQRGIQRINQVLSILKANG
jgi:hypothetical protein